MKHKLTENLLALYGAHIARYLFPLITLPYLARVLSASVFGQVAFVQAYGVYVSLVVQYGFNLYATREVSRLRDSKNDLSVLVSDILGSQTILVLLSLIISVPVGLGIPMMRENPTLFWVGVAGGSSWCSCSAIDLENQAYCRDLLIILRYLKHCWLK